MKTVRNTFRSAAVAGAVLGLAATVVVAIPAQAAPLPTPPTIESVTFNGPHSFNLTGTAVGTATVDARITAPDGAAEWCQSFGSLRTPLFEVARVSGTGGAALWYSDRNMKLISGNCNDGVWRGTLTFTAWQSGGTFKVSRIVATRGSDSTGGADSVAVDPSSLGTDTTVTVSGGDAPFLAVSTRPSVVTTGYQGKVTTYFLLYQRDSKKRLSGRPISLCIDEQCGDGFGAPINFGSGVVVITDAAGRASTTWDHPQAAQAGFYRANSGMYWDDVLYDSAPMVPNYPKRATISASASPSTISLGATTKLFGNSWPVSFGDRSLVIQKWVNHAWVQLGRAQIRDSGRWDYTTRPNARGNHVYRVWRPSSSCDHGRCYVTGTTTGSIPVAVR